MSSTTITTEATTPLPRALELARRVRREHLTISPYELWEASEGDGALYRHAMIEAGAVGKHLPDGSPCKRGHFGCEVKAHFQLYAVCPECGVDMTNE